jgi:hypothetical protein
VQDIRRKNKFEDKFVTIAYNFCEISMELEATKRKGCIVRNQQKIEATMQYFIKTIIESIFH